MRIAFLPAGDESVASSRLRVHAVIRALHSLGVEAGVGVTGGAGDVLIVQKRVDAQVVEQAADFAGRGGIVLYDADDTGTALDWWAPPRPRRRLLRLATGVISDTPGHLADLRRMAHGLPGEVVPDMVDYGATAPAGPAEPVQPPLRILWFGSASNAAMLERRLPALLAIREAEIVACTALPPGSPLPGRWPGVRWEQWTAGSFVATLRSCHLSLLPHDGGRADRGKSDNRLAASLCWGVAAAATRTPAYAATAIASGIPDALFDDDRSMISVIEGLRDAAARRRQLAVAQPRLWAMRSPETVAGILLTAIGRLAAGPPRSSWLRSLLHGGRP